MSTSHVIRYFFTPLCIVSSLLLTSPVFAEIKADGTAKIGDACTSSSQCVTGNCEDSFCVCNDKGASGGSAQCAARYYGQPADWKCLDDSEDKRKYHGDWLQFCQHKSFPGGTKPDTSNDQVKYPQDKKSFMGYACNSTADCITDNSDSLDSWCEETKFNSSNDPSSMYFDPWYTPGRKLKVCECGGENLTETGELCALQYGGSASDWPTTGTDVISICRESESPDLNGLQVCRKSDDWMPKTLLEMRSPLTLVAKNPDLVKTDFLGFDISMEAPELVTPTTKIGIPGVFFTNITKATHITTDESGASWLNIPFLGEFIAAIYKYSVGLVSLIAVMVIIISGVQITTSAGNSEAISGAKHRIISSVIAIILTAGSYTILYTVNPELVNLRNLKILVVPHQALEIPEESDTSIANTPTDAQGNVINTVSNVGGVLTGADGPVTKRPASINEITANEFKKDRINNIPTDGWAIWQGLDDTQKTTVLPYLFIKTGSCTTSDIVKTNIDTCGWKNILMHKTVIPLFKQAMQNAEKYGFQLCPGSSYRDLNEETQLWNTGVIGRFKQGTPLAAPSNSNKGWNTNQGLIAKPSCTAPHSSGGAADVALRKIGDDTNVTNFSGKMDTLAQGIAYYSSLENANVYATILEEIMYQSGWVRYCQEKWHFETAVTIRYSKWTNRSARCVMAWDNWVIPIPDAVKQKANTLTTQPIFP